MAIKHLRRFLCKTNTEGSTFLLFFWPVISATSLEGQMGWHPYCNWQVRNDRRSVTDLLIGMWYASSPVCTNWSQLFPQRQCKKGSCQYMACILQQGSLWPSRVTFSLSYSTAPLKNTAEVWQCKGNNLNSDLSSALESWPCCRWFNYLSPQAL